LLFACEPPEHDVATKSDRLVPQQTAFVLTWIKNREACDVKIVVINASHGKLPGGREVLNGDLRDRRQGRRGRRACWLGCLDRS
jgi:hypothetical protein